MKKFSYSLIVFLSCLFANAQDTISFYFESGKYELLAKEKLRLNEWIVANSTSKILAIHGFTDEVGTSASNDTLSKNRVHYIYNQINGKVAIRNDFKTISFGENFKRDQEQAKNRRASIFYLQEKDLAKENEILGIEIEKKEPIIIPDSLPFHEKIKLAQVGTKITLKNINFYQNTFQTTQDSQASLYDLLFVMQNNPNLKIQIQGHICCVDKDRRNLSLERAKQIRRFLQWKGIPQGRVSVTGFGTTQPIYPIPEANEEQAAANRRVEIEILSK
ncbi:OmpA family protein [Flavobacterium sp.]|uniref:OmpA family protein n=1 Tax=Flavobacterium sp. TaxID=239 RepID=UPI003528D82E